MNNTDIPNLVNELSQYGMTVLPTGLDWSGETSFAINSARVDVSWTQAQRYCEMLSAVREIGRALWDIVPRRCRSGYTTKANLFQHIFGSINIERVVSTTMTGAPMQANRDGTIQISNSGISGTARNCFYNVFMHEISHVFDYRWQIDSQSLASIYEQPFCSAEDRNENGTCRPSSSLLVNTAAGLTYNMRRREDNNNNTERMTDALANLFMSSFSNDLMGELRDEQMHELVSAIACIGTRIQN